MADQQGVPVQQPQRKRRSVWVWVVICFALVLLGGLALIVLGFSAIFAGQAAPQIKPDSTLVLSLDRPVQETPPDPIATELFKAKIYSVYDINLALLKAAKDERIKSAFLNVSFPQMGFAKMQEIRSYIEEFKKSKKPVVAYFEVAGNGGYYLASCADKVYAPPSSDLMLSGLLSETPFLRGTLDKLRIEPQLYHIGDYKSYSDIFMRKEMSDAHREANNALLDSIFGQFVKGIAAGRKLDEESVKAAVDRGMLWGAELKERKLVDDLFYMDQVEAELKKINGNKEAWNTVDIADYAKDHRVDPYADAKSALGLVLASGGIVSGDEDSPNSRDSIVSGAVVKLLKKVEKDKDIKAVVFRVDSPGGSAIASDMIWRQVQLVRKVKPVVVSMSDVAASGGYWVSMGSDGIVAQPATITGSIGVVSGKFVMKGMMDWIELNQDVMKRGANADMWSGYSRFSPEQEQIIVSQMEQIYGQFVDKVAEGRKKTPDEIRAIAQGRVWTGEHAIQNGLVDQLGGMRDAFALAKEKAKISKGEAVRIKVYPKPKTIVEALFNVSKDDLARARVEAALPLELLDLYRTYEAARPYLSEPVSAYCPVDVRVR